MARYRRPRRRQGVVYGSARGFDAAEDSGLLGRVLGPVVVVGAFGLLAVAAWSLAGTGAPPPATPTAGAIVSPSPSPSPSSPTAPPTLLPSPTPTATLPPSPSPSPFVIEVREGPGAITFGTEHDEQTLRVTDPRTSFPARGRFVWSAELTEPAGAPELTIEVSAYDPANGVETVVYDEVDEVSNERASIFLRRLPMQRLVDGPGIYVVRYYRGEILLAEGFFGVESP